MNNKTHKLVLTAMLIALGTVLSMVKIYDLPMGGSITLLSMLPIAMIAVCYGTTWGLTGAFLYSIIQLAMSQVLSWGLTPAVLIACIFLDYIIAFTVIGLSGLFRNKGTKGICLGVFISLVLRFVCHYISGVVLWGVYAEYYGMNEYVYSLVYNGSYMLPELIFTLIGAFFLFKTPQIKKIIEGKAV